MVPCFGTGLIVFGELGEGHMKLLVFLYHAVGAPPRQRHHCLAEGLFVYFCLF
jgi:hypothetical protein